ncbi:sensor domain-containing diguanylate cyclase [Cupriavidus sp. PET2-C1]
MSFDLDMRASTEAETRHDRIDASKPLNLKAALQQERFDALTRLAQHLFRVPVALVTLHDVPHDAHPGDVPILIDGLRMGLQAACPLTTSSGSQLGAFCLFDAGSRELDQVERGLLQDFADMAVALIERDPAQDKLNDAGRLEENEKRLELAIAGSGTGVWDRDVQAGSIHYSAGWKAIIGYEASEITNRIEDSYTRVHPDDLAYVQATIQAHFNQETESYAVDHRIRCKDGSYKWISSRGKVVSRASNGEPLRMIGTTTDITAIRALSEELQQTVDLITSLTNEVPGLVFQHRLLPTGESFLPYASAGIADIYELTPQQVAASTAPIHAVIHPDDLQAYCASLRASAASLTPWHLEYRVDLPRQGLRWRQGDARPRRLDDGSTLWHGFITDVTERKRIERELQEFATIDFLTQLPNRRHFVVRIEQELARIRRTDSRPAAVLTFDLDHFKAINDTWGHAMGDHALRCFAALLRNALQTHDFAGRIGGEEFAVVLPDASLDAATRFARRVQHQIAETPLLDGGQIVTLTVSVGIALMHATDPSADLSLLRSDGALYRAKERGRNRVECY